MAKLNVFIADFTDKPGYVRDLADSLEAAGVVIWLERVGADPATWEPTLSDTAKFELYSRPVAIVALDDPSALMGHMPKIVRYLVSADQTNPLRLTVLVFRSSAIQTGDEQSMKRLAPLVAVRTPQFSAESGKGEIGQRIRRLLALVSSGEASIDARAQSDSPDITAHYTAAVTDKFAHARALALQGRHALALRLFEDLKRDPVRLAGLWTALAHTYLAVGEWDKCVEAGRRAWGEMFELVTAVCCLGYGLLGQGQANAALGPFRRALSVSPDYPAAWVGYGKALAAVGRRDDALTAFNRALMANRNNPWAYENDSVLATAAEEYARLAP